MDNKPFRQGTIDQFLDDLGSKKAAPGGGAAAGLVGAQACALAEMVCHLTESNKNYAEFHEKAAEYAAVFQMARSIFLDLMDEDAKSFLELMNTGHSGTMSSIHADSPDLMFDRLASMASRGGADMSKNQLIEFSRHLIDVVIQWEYGFDGRRIITEVQYAKAA